MLSHTNLLIYYQKHFGLIQHHKYSISDLDNLIPYERDLYHDMLLEFLKKLEEKNKNKR